MKFTLNLKVPKFRHNSNKENRLRYFKKITFIVRIIRNTKQNFIFLMQVVTIYSTLL